MEKRVVLDRIEIEADGTIFIRLLKQIVDGAAVLSSEPHPFPVLPPAAAADQVAIVNQHLAQMGWPAVTPADISRLSAHADVARTPEVVAAFKAKAAKAVTAKP